MRNKRVSIRWCTVLAIFALGLLAEGASAAAQQLTVLHNFNNAKGGNQPSFGLIRDAAGNLYGMTGWDWAPPNNCTGGPRCGVVFELTPPTAGGGWKEKVLHVFQENGKDGWAPGGSLIFDAAGNLYGETQFGGIFGGGTVFRLTPNADGGWTEKILHNFGPGIDGSLPAGGLIFDAAGNLYGTTFYGGADRRRNAGMVFELVPDATGGFTEKILHSFQDDDRGCNPTGGVTLDAAGNLYGTVTDLSDRLIVFELSPVEGGGWTKKLLHRFCRGCGISYFPPASGGLVLDAAGNLYGTTASGGASGSGTVFELSPVPGGGWAEHALLSSCPGCYASLVFDAAGNLYGASSATVFELSPTAGGGWTEHVLYTGITANGVILDPAGNLYGTTTSAGKYDVGEVFEITP